MNPIFVTGIGTGVGKTLVAAILAQALKADYWKPVQAGINETDSNWIRSHVENPLTIIHPELYALKLPASPHIAAREEGLRVEIGNVVANLPSNNRILIVEGAGGLMVPLNESEFVIDLIKALNCRVALVSRNYLGSINHSLLTAQVCRQNNVNVAGWIFNDQFMHYEDEIVEWSGYPKIASIPFNQNPDPRFVSEQAEIVGANVEKYLC
jgi:dethiobiotin synthetase